MNLHPADRPRPGPAPVSAHSDFEPVATATALPWSAAEPGEVSGSGRIVIDLGGRWERWADEGGDPSFPAPGARAAGPTPGKVEWRRVVVPENFGFDGELSAQFAPVWYKRRFADPRSADLPESPPRVQLHFHAVDYLADVWLNGEHLGHHEGYFAPFGFDVTERLRKDNALLVAVQDPLDDLDPSEFFFRHRKRVIKGTLKYHDSRPGGLPGRMTSPLAPGDDPWVWTSEWGQSMTTAGITGPVELVRTGEVSLDALFVTPLAAAAGGIQLAAVMTNHTAAARPVRLHLEVGDERAALEVTLPPGAGRVDARTELPTLEPWEPVHSPRGRPALHELAAVVSDPGGDRALDRRTLTFGIRRARVVIGDDGRARHLEVNERPVFVKAVNYIPWQHFAEVGRSFYDRDMRMLADAHANSVGVHAHVQSPHCYDATDSAGVLVFQDFPLQWFYDCGTETNPGFVQNACHQIADMAYLLHGHPSVVYYACHNEPLRQFVPTKPDDDTPERDLGERHLDEALEATLRSVDDSRHVHQASGIGDDVHEYQGSLSGGSLYRVGEQPAWFVSEYGFWTVGPQAEKFGDERWPPDDEQMRQWVSRLSFIGSTCGFAGLPSRYPSLAVWSEATLAYGAALAKHQTEWFRAHRGHPFMGYRWHFWSDWWGYAGGGLVDVDRVTKRTYDAYRDASRPLLVLALADRSVYEPGDVALPVVVVNDTHEPWRGDVQWEVHEASSSVIAPDPDGSRIGLAFPATDGALVAVPRNRGRVLERGTLTVEAPAEAATDVGSVTVVLEPGQARTIVFRWDGDENFVHLHCPAAGEQHPPGLSHPHASRT